MQGFRLGSLFGFEIRVDLSWLLIFFLILWTLTVNLFPLNYPELPGSSYIVMGITGTILFFVSLVLHELSHSLVAKTKGIPVEGITLFAFGGVSRTRMDAETPGDEFQIAGVGPLTSLGLAGLFGLISYIGQGAGWSVVITGVAAYLAWINIILAAFNLLPGFPLDGGRLFRATLWKFTNNLKKATRIASIGGRLLGFGLITWGFLQLFSPVSDFIGGLWLIVIGWFLNNAAESSYQDLVIRSMLEGLRVREVATLNPETVPASLTLQELMDGYFFNRSYQSFPVMENDRPIGLVTLNQVKQIPRDEWNRRTVKNIMLPVGMGITVHLGDKMTQVVEKMRNARTQRLLVTDNGNLQGIISATDLANSLQRQRDFGDDIPQPRTFSEQISNNLPQESKV
ncbi:peptidase M50 [Calothrix parasitica NIES-267]|uniref:Zinc metalloprotease n=1 Tax=Calothrix parasitica NIES-267 TaxID=1973488 RepID=A0A1Z4LTV3_9CYAN|nr:peptidase M50 [Calothrix parasitica NIES-267]